MEKHPPLDPCLSGLDPETAEWFRMRPYFVQKLLWNLEVQGDFVALGSKEKQPVGGIGAKRGSINSFSRASRLRQLKLVARIDWSRATDGLFISLTYPTGKEIQSARARNIHLHRFRMYMENYLGREIPLLWRVEWEPRKSGPNAGTWAAHIHIITFTGKFIHHRIVRHWWRTILQHRGDLSTDIDALNGKKKFGIYVAKYTAKPPPASSLDYAAYPKTEGRHWGTLRRKKIPLCRRVMFREITPRMVMHLQQFASALLDDYRPQYDRGFSLLGKKGEGWRDAIVQLALDESLIAEYNS